MVRQDAHTLWNAALGSLQVEVTRHNYDTWLKSSVGLTLSDSKLTVGVPSAFVAEQLEKRLTTKVLATLEQLAGGPLEVQYTVQQVQPNGEVALPLGPHAAPDSSRAAATPAERTSRLNPRYTFDTFVVGKSNRFAHAAAVAVSDSPGNSYNPLFIHAGTGLGKTHLLNAIGHAASEKGLSCIYVSAEHFTNDFVTAVRENRTEEFRNTYRTTDVLLIDDIQFIAGKEHSKESFFHTFNDLHAANRQIVITSDSRPKSIPLVEERLISRFEGGLIADIQPPELETRMAILESKAALAGMKLASDVADFIARKILRNVRELEGALTRLLAMARISNRPIDIDMAQEAIAHIPAPERHRNFSQEAILEAVIQFYRLAPGALTSKSRKKEVVRARQVAAYLLREETARSLADVGKLLGERGHTTALRAHAKIAHAVTVQSDLRQDITAIRSLLEQTQRASA